MEQRCCVDGTHPYSFRGGFPSRFGLFGSDRLMNEEAFLPPTIELKNGDQGQATKKIGSQHVAGPVLAEVNSRNPNETNQAA